MLSCFFSLAGRAEEEIQNFPKNITGKRIKDHLGKSKGGISMEEEKEPKKR